VSRLARLDVVGLTKRLGDRVVLDGISLTVDAGRAVAVVGANGAGKTTLLRCVVGALIPDAGEIRLDGRPLRETDPTARAAVACVLDDVDFFPDLSVAEHLDLLARAHGDTEPDLAGVLGEFGLTAAAAQLPVTLSSGQRRRFMLASCFVRPRSVLVLDEPEQRLDVVGRQGLTKRLLAEKGDGRAILLATHDDELRDAVADEIVAIG